MRHDRARLLRDARGNLIVELLRREDLESEPASFGRELRRLHGRLHERRHPLRVCLVRHSGLEGLRVLDHPAHLHAWRAELVDEALDLLRRAEAEHQVRRDVRGADDHLPHHEVEARALPEVRRDAVVAAGLHLEPERRAVDDAREAVDDRDARREGKRPLVDAPERLEKHGRLHRARRVHRRRGVPLDRHARPEVLHDDPERRLPLGGECIEDLPERTGLRRSQAGGARGAGERGEAAGVAEARRQPLAHEGRLLRRRDAVLRRLDDVATAGPERHVVDLLRRSEEDEVARGELLDADRDELRVAEAHLRAVPEEEYPVPLEDAPDEAGAVEAPGSRSAPGVGGAEKAAGHREPGGRVEDRRSLARPLGGDVVGGDEPVPPVGKEDLAPFVLLGLQLLQAAEPGADRRGRDRHGLLEARLPVDVREVRGDFEPLRRRIGGAGPDRGRLDPAPRAGAGLHEQEPPLGARGLDRLAEDRLVLHGCQRLGPGEDVGERNDDDGGRRGRRRLAGRAGGEEQGEGNGPEKPRRAERAHRAHNPRMTAPLTRRDLLAVSGSLAASALLPGVAAAATPKAAAATGVTLDLKPMLLKLRHTWTISRGSSDEKKNGLLTLTSAGITGYGETAANKRYGQSWESGEAAFAKVKDGLRGPLSVGAPRVARAGRSGRRGRLAGRRRPRHGALGLEGEGGRPAGLEAPRHPDGADGPDDLLHRHRHGRGDEGEGEGGRALPAPEGEGGPGERRGERHGDPLGDEEADPRRRERGVGDAGGGVEEDRVAEDDGNRVRRAAAAGREERGDEGGKGGVGPPARGGRVGPPREGRPVARRPLRRRERQARQVRRNHPRLRARGPRPRARLQADARLHDRVVARHRRGGRGGAPLRLARPRREPPRRERPVEGADAEGRPLGASVRAGARRRPGLRRNSGPRAGGFPIPRAAGRAAGASPPARGPAARPRSTERGRPGRACVRGRRAGAPRSRAPRGRTVPSGRR